MTGAERFAIVKRSPESSTNFAQNVTENLWIFLNCRDWTSEGIFNVLVEYGQNDTKFKLGDTIRYTPLEVKEILDERK